MKSDTSVTPDPGTPTPDMKMTATDFAELRAQATAIGTQDRQLGAVLHNLILHIGHAFGLDPAQEDARIAAQVRTDMRAEEDARLKDEADMRVSIRATEDAAAMTPEQTAALAARRAIEEKRLKDEADERAKIRADEDAATKGA